VSYKKRKLRRRMGLYVVTATIHVAKYILLPPFIG